MRNAPLRPYICACIWRAWRRHHGEEGSVSETHAKRERKPICEGINVTNERLAEMSCIRHRATWLLLSILYHPVSRRGEASRKIGRALSRMPARETLSRMARAPRHGIIARKSLAKIWTCCRHDIKGNLIIFSVRVICLSQNRCAWWWK